MTAVVAYVEPYLARNGGPIIMSVVVSDTHTHTRSISIGNHRSAADPTASSVVIILSLFLLSTQIENEYGGYNQYVEWCGNLTKQLNTDTVWIMCKQQTPPEPLIAACNGGDCSYYVQDQQASGKPAMWTEDWIAWFQHWGDPIQKRDCRDIAQAVASFFAKGGSYQNYYMWQGGSNFGRNVGGPNIVTSYDYDGALDEYGVPHEPKYTHLSRLHAVLSSYANVLMGYNYSLPFGLSRTVEAYTYGQEGQLHSVVFLRNNGSDNETVSYRGKTFTLAPLSVLILDGALLQVMFDSDDISTIPIPAPPAGLPSVSARDIAFFPEPIGVWSSENLIHSKSPLEQINLTMYTTIYLWYNTLVTLSSTDLASGNVTIGLSNAWDHQYFYLDGSYMGRADGAWWGDLTNFSMPIPQSASKPSQHRLSILSITQGLDNGADSALQRGLNGGVTFNYQDIIYNTWTHQIGTLGEYLQIFTPTGSGSVTWNKTSPGAPLPPMTWFRLSVPTPTPVGDPAYATWAFDMSGMGKGELWCNGFMVGAYWSIRDSNGDYSQRYYHMPRDYLVPAGEMNLVVVLEEVSGDPTSIRLMQRNQRGVKKEQMLAIE